MKKFARFVVLLGNITAVALMVAVFATALTSEPTETQDASGMAGLGAALIALGIGMMLVFGHGDNSDGLRLAHRLLIGISAIAGAYLWIAAETVIHPSQPELLGELSILVVAAAGVALIVWPIAHHFVSSPSNAESQNKSGDGCPPDSPKEED